jgi:glycosyltransferase involved in cell wall biosynthesis
VARAYHPAVSYGGPVISLRRMCSMLAAAGHDVRVVCSNMASPGMGGTRIPAGRYVMEDVRVRFLRTPLRYRWEGLSLEGLTEIPRGVREADVVHVTGARHFLGVVAETAARRYGKPYLVMPEGSIPPRFRSILPKRLVDAVYTRRSLERAFRVLATSDAEAEDLRAWGIRQDRILVLPPRADRIEPSPRPVEELRRVWDVPDNAPVLLWMGRIHREKGLPLLLQAMGDPRLHTAHLLLAGDAEDRVLARSLKERAALAPLRNRVRFLGWAGPTQKSELMKLADLFVFPSRKENFGLAAAEAVAAGLPVVVTEGCGIAALVRDRAGLVCRYDAGALAEVLARALGDPELLNRLRAGTVETAASLGWPPLVGYLEGVYRQAMRTGAEHSERPGDQRIPR